MATIAFSGVFTGTVASMLLSGVLADTLGWEWVFYILGAFGCLWFVAWMLIVKKSPESDPYITTKEKEFILATLQRSAAGGEKVQHPWRGILTSKAVWALIVSSFSENWGFYTLLTQLPTFLRGECSLVGCRLFCSSPACHNLTLLSFPSQTRCTLSCRRPDSFPHYRTS